MVKSMTTLNDKPARRRVLAAQVGRWGQIPTSGPGTQTRGIGSQPLGYSHPEPFDGDASEERPDGTSDFRIRIREIRG